MPIDEALDCGGKSKGSEDDACINMVDLRTVVMYCFCVNKRTPHKNRLQSDE